MILLDVGFNLDIIRDGLKICILLGIDYNLNITSFDIDNMNVLNVIRHHL